MKRLLLFAAIFMTGCASHARYIEQSSRHGVVAVPEKDYRNEAMFLIVKHFGIDYKILSEGNTVCGSKVDEKTGAVSTGTEYRIYYTRASDPMPYQPPFATVPVQPPAPPSKTQGEGTTP